ncbi:AAA family ATPase [Orrella sp. 11846]|uniref:bifunctional aminoglycoside phosphotransferase/ATP-binding protein n=1 Tax=Orrella sp. 11846 TaxID=3409913 RepID=UPI003B5C0462
MNSHNQLVKHLAHHLSETVCQTAEEPCEPNVQIIQTHISSVILAGPYAYKIKRNIKLPFLDFSTLDKRHKYCVKEVTLNQRTAPEIYLDVVPITGSIENPEIQGDGPVIEWAVKMKRFAPGQLFSDLAQQGMLTEQHATSFAHHIAEFHLAREPLDVNRLAHVKTTPHWFAESVHELKALCKDDEQKQVQLQALEEFNKRMAQTLRTQMPERIAQGWYREGHGDLHLANITCTAKGIVAFDALEFDDDLRAIDLICEIAFPFMDLLAHGEHRLAWVFLNQYLQLTGDYTGLAYLEYYVRYRALVRSKVSLLRIKQSNDSSSQERVKQQRLKQQFEAYWHLACGPNITQTTPHLILVSGLSGSGKSTAAQEICQQLGAVWLRADVERQRLFPDTDSKQRYHPDASDRTYAHLATLSQMLLKHGFHVIVDATFLAQHQVDRFVESEHQTSHWQTHAVICKAPENKLKNRIETRLEIGTDPSEATVDVLTKQIKTQQDAPIQWPFETYELHNDSTLEALYHRIEKWLKTITTKTA